LLQLVVRRLILLIPTLLLVTFGVFSLVALVPGDAAVTLAGGASATPDRIAAVRTELHLDESYLAQYWRWLSHAVHFDFGKSLFQDKSVSHEIASRLPVTLSIVIGAVVIGLLLAVPIGLYTGARHGGRADRVLLFLTSGSMAVPNFVLAILLIEYLSVRLGWFDAVGFTHLTENGSLTSLHVFDWLRSLTLPSLSLGVGIGARLARQIRSGVVDVLDEPYVRTAWAKGCSPRRVIGKHVFKNAAMPSVTVAGLMIGALLGGTAIVEQIFSIPGVGDYLVSAILLRDLPVIQGGVIMFVLGFVLINLVVDIVYGWLNPKIEVS
jgi:peptide/nickel transport system permease protein